LTGFLSRRDAVERVEVSVHRVPTERPESDGTFEWDATTLVLVRASGAGKTGIGYTYADRATGVFIEEHLRDRVVGADVLAPDQTWDAMRHAIRNMGRPGVASMAMAAVDTALWDLKARALELPLYRLLGARRDAIPLYASGGFTSLTDTELATQLAEWARRGFRMVKMKIGRDPVADIRRVALARNAIGPAVELFVDANGAYTPHAATNQGKRFAEHAVTWFEEPVSSDDLDGLACVRRQLGGMMDIAAGEYGYDLPYFDRIIRAGAVDVLQADVTRCAGITELLRVDALCEAADMPLSLHTAPALHLHVACALGRLRHLEYFIDHVRVEHALFGGVAEARNGMLAPDPDAPGNGLSLCHDHAG
jgi:L-alanine-DL-glutamate epimerase-like enolase superfamily enzyme